MRFQRQSKKPQFPKAENASLHGKKVTETPEISHMDSHDSKSSAFPAQKIRNSKGNQELYAHLRSKADELEKLFAELRNPSNRAVSSSQRGNKPTYQLPEKNRQGSSTNGLDFNLNSRMTNRNDGSNPKQQKAEFGSSDEDSRGALYERYIQKRDAKRREESGLKRAQKEAVMKAMLSSLESSRAEMMAKFSGSVNRQDTSVHTRQPAEKPSSFGVHTSAENKEQVAEPFKNNEKDLPRLSELAYHGHDGSFNETLFSNCSSRSTHSKKVLPNKVLPSPTPRNSVAALPRSFVKPASSGAGRQPEDPSMLVPTSNSRKENTKPSTGNRKTLPSQFGNYACSKSTSKEMFLVKEEKLRPSPSLRKSSANPDQTPHDSVAAPLANPKLTENHQSGSSLKAPRSFFSLTSFRSKGSNSKPSN